MRIACDEAAVRRLFAARGDEGNKLPAGDLPGLLATYESECGQPMMAPALAAQVTSFAAENGALEIDRDEFLTLLQTLQSAQDGDSEADSTATSLFSTETVSPDTTPESVDVPVKHRSAFAQEPRIAAHMGRTGLGVGIAPSSRSFAPSPAAQRSADAGRIHVRAGLHTSASERSSLDRLSAPRVTEHPVLSRSHSAADVQHTADSVPSASDPRRPDDLRRSASVAGVCHADSTMESSERLTLSSSHSSDHVTSLRASASERSVSLDRRAALIRKLAKVNESLEFLQAQYADLQADKAEQDAAHAALQRQAKALRRDLHEAHTHEHVLSTQIVELESHVASLQQQRDTQLQAVRTMETQLSEQLARATDMEASEAQHLDELEALRATCDAYAVEVAHLRTRCDSQREAIANLETTVEALERAHADADRFEEEYHSSRVLHEQLQLELAAVRQAALVSVPVLASELCGAEELASAALTERGQGAVDTAHDDGAVATVEVVRDVAESAGPKEGDGPCVATDDEPAHGAPTEAAVLSEAETEAAEQSSPIALTPEAVQTEPPHVLAVAVPSFNATEAPEAFGAAEMPKPSDVHAPLPAMVPADTVSERATAPSAAAPAPVAPTTPVAPQVTSPRMTDIQRISRLTPHSFHASLDGALSAPCRASLVRTASATAIFLFPLLLGVWLGVWLYHLSLRAAPAYVYELAQAQRWADANQLYDPFLAHLRGVPVE